MLSMLLRAKVLNVTDVPPGEHKLVARALVEIEQFALGHKRSICFVVWLPEYHKRRMEFLKGQLEKYVTIRANAVFPVLTGNQVQGKDVAAELLIDEIDY